MSRCKWCNSEIGDNVICPKCKANQKEDINSSKREKLSPFEKYENNGSSNRVRTTDKEKSSNNSIASLIKGVAVILLVVGGIGSFIMLLDDGFIGLIALVGCVISSLFCFGFSEIIYLLQDIKDKL